MMRVPPNKLTKLQLVELDTCSRCAHCAEYCPIYVERRRPELVPGGRVALLSKLVGKKNVWPWASVPKAVKPEELEKSVNSLYTCSLCGRCLEVCPFSIQTPELWERFRIIVHDAGRSPEPLKLLGKTIAEKKNPYGADSELRTFWIGRRGLKDAPIMERANTVYFIGCTPALKSQTQGIAYATSLILNQVKEDWTLLGDKEWCCGSPSIMLGDYSTATELAKHNVETIESTGASKVVASCPSCYRMLKFKYPQIIGRSPKFEVVHAIRLLIQYLKRGLLAKSGKIEGITTYHDPCELARLSFIIKEPREILKFLADRLVELPENKMDARCCGGGGLLQAVDVELRLKIAQSRIKQAEGIKAELLASACPACKLTLFDATKSMNSNIKVLDIAELVAQKTGLM